MSFEYASYFNPQGYPVNYVERSLYDQILVDNLKAGESGLVLISGPSGIGKSVLTQHVAKKHPELLGHFKKVTVSGYDVAKLGLWATVGSAIGLKLGQKVEIASETAGRMGFQDFIGGNISRSATRELEITTSDIELRLRQKRFVLVIEDFHFVPYEATDNREHEQIIQTLKSLIEEKTIHGNTLPGIKIVLIFIETKWMRESGVVGSPQLRSEHIRLKLWNMEDLSRITKIDANNMSISIEKIPEFAMQCFGLPQVMHRFCRYVCQLHFQKSRNNIVAVNHKTFQKVCSNVASTQLWDEDMYYIVTDNPWNVANNRISRRDNGHLGNINQMIWYAITKYKPFEKSNDIRIDDHNQVEITIPALNRRLHEVASANNSLSEEAVRESVKWMSEVANEKYKKQIEEKKNLKDPLFEYDDRRDSLRVYYPSFLVGLRHSPHHDEQFKIQFR